MSEADTHAPQDDAPHPELARLLDGWKPGRANPAFRASLRARFVERAPEEGARELLNAHTGAPARDEFKSQLAARFLSGDFEQGAAVEPSAGGVEAHPARPAPGRARGRARGRAPVKRRGGPVAPRKPNQGRRLLAGAVLAAAAALVFFMNRTAVVVVEWAPSLESGSVLVDGHPLTGFSATDVRELLATATTIGTEESEARVRFGDYFVVELGPTSELDLTQLLTLDPVADGFVLGGELGSFRFSTGPAFKPAGASLTFRSPDLEIAVIGTVFAVDIYAGQGTCICCSSGEVEVRCRTEGVTNSVPNGEMRFVFDDGQEARAGAIQTDHLEPLEGLTGYWR